MSEDFVASEKPMWFIAYDVESENSKSLKPNEKDWLRTQRVSIWYILRFRYKCVPIQNSLWLIRDQHSKDELEKQKDAWLAEYAKLNFKALIEIFPIQTNEAGYKTFKSWEFEFILEWLGKIEKSLVKARDVGKIAKKNIQAHTKKIQLLENILKEDFDDSFPNWNLAQDCLVNVWDMVNEVRQYQNAADS
jgi:hypothetical protein